MKRTKPNRIISGVFVALALLMSVPTMAEDRGNNDRQISSWSLPSQSMRDIKKEKAAKKAAEEANARGVARPVTDETGAARSATVQ